MTVHFKKTPTTSAMQRLAQSAIDLGNKFVASLGTFTTEKRKLTAADIAAIEKAEAKRQRRKAR